MKKVRLALALAGLCLSGGKCYADPAPNKAPKIRFVRGIKLTGDKCSSIDIASILKTSKKCEYEMTNKVKPVDCASCCGGLSNKPITGCVYENIEQSANGICTKLCENPSL